MDSTDMILEGSVSVNAALESGNRRVGCVYISDDGKDRRKSAYLASLARKANAKGAQVIYTTYEKIEQMTCGNTHGGVCAEVGERQYLSLEHISEEDGFYVYLDGIEDPFNFGQAIRAIYASGAKGLILPTRNWMSAAGVVARSSAGASERIPACSHDGEEAVRYFKNKGYKIVCADHSDVSVDMRSADLTGKLLLIIGGERRGISAKIKALADITVQIGYGRDFNASLGAAEACAVLCFEVLRQADR